MERETGRHRGVATLLLATLLAVGLSVSLFVLSGCGTVGDHSSDAESIQGLWQVKGTKMTVVITGNQIRMPGNTNYDYTIDTVDQTISFSVGDVAGEAAYKLGTDSKSGVVTLTLTESLDGTDTDTTFVRLSDDTSATPSKDGGQDVFATTDEG